MSIWKQNNKILVTCPKGVATYLRTELETLGFPILNEIDTAIQTEGTLEDAMFLNLHLHTAQRVLYQLQLFKVASPGALYERVNAIPWETILHDSGKRAYVCITSIVDNPLITDSRFVNVKVKDAIVDRIREKCNVRPDSGPDKDKAVVHVYWKNDQAIIYIDTSGDRLAMRGYRKIPLQAPMQETLAAAVILAAGWQGRGTFINPMCGSGTLAIEAALICLYRSPGLSRNNFGFMYIKDFPHKIWDELRKKARSKARKTLQAKIIATDIDERAVQAARQNAQTAGVEHMIEFKTCPFEETPIPQGGGIIMLNPPYGHRLDATTAKRQYPESKKESMQGRSVIVRKAADRKINDRSSQTNTLRGLETMYEGIGNFFKQTGGGYRGYIFTGNLDMAKKVGLRTKRRLTFYNGEIECRLLEYELYAGSKKHPEPDK